MEETGKGLVEAIPFMCQGHANEESPTKLDQTYDDYVTGLQAPLNEDEAVWLDADLG